MIVVRNVSHFFGGKNAPAVLEGVQALKLAGRCLWGDTRGGALRSALASPSSGASARAPASKDQPTRAQSHEEQQPCREFNAFATGTGQPG
eukprot:1979706-Rhodomonas_salina.1